MTRGPLLSLPQPHTPHIVLSGFGWGRGGFFGQRERQRFDIQLLARDDFFKIAVAMGAGVKVVLQGEFSLTLQAQRPALPFFDNAFGTLEHRAFYRGGPNEVQGLQLYTSQLADFQRDGVYALGFSLLKGFISDIDYPKGDRHFMHSPAVFSGTGNTQ
jgi:hypothetical protein